MNWKELLQIDDQWLTDFLNEHPIYEKHKIKMRGYSVKFSGNLYSFTGLAEYLSQKIPEFVYSKSDIEELGERKAILNAIKYFGQKDPVTDGKYGELFLFMLVESVLKCPMIAYKIQALSNFKDQVKGGDGIFLGEYEFNSDTTVKACLIGESKIMTTYASGLNDALSSLDRFYDKYTSGQFETTEYMVAKKNIANNLDCDIDYLYNSLTPGTPEFSENTIVHPIFLMYDTKKISSIEEEAINSCQAESLMKDYFITEGKRQFKQIQDKIEKWPNLKRVILDFFIIPSNDVEKFRNDVYYQIHGTPFQKVNEL